MSPSARQNPGRALRQALLLGAGLTAVAAVTQLGREATQERQGRRPHTYAATRISTPPPRGVLAGAIDRAAAPHPPVGLRAVIVRAWAAPTTAVGLVLGAASLGRWRWSHEHGAIIVRGARSPLLRLAGFEANAIGHIIVALPDPVPERLLVHEVAHVRQAERLGPFTLPMYLWWTARHGYRNHPMERGARRTTRAWLENW